MKLGGDINILRKKESLNSDFMAYYLTYVKNKEIAKKGQGTTIIHLYAKDLQDIKIDCISEIEQGKISNLMKKLDDLLILNKQQKQNYENLKKGLMQKLLTGKVRVKI